MNNLVEVVFEAGPIGLNVIWNDKLKAVVVKGFRPVNGRSQV